MPNYNLVINSKFEPFSFERYISPYSIYGEAYKATENEYADLATKSNVWEELANEQSDPYAYNLYKSYSKDLEEQANLLAKDGLTPTSRQSMLKMKQRYSSDIVPIEQAYARKQALVDEQRNALLKDNTLLFNKDAAMLSLDDLIKNPQLTYQSYSGATLARQVGEAAKNLAKEMRNNPREWRSTLYGQYFETMMQEGFRPEEIVKVLQKDPNASPILKKLVDDVVASSGIANWNDESILNRAWDYAGQGLWNAVGDTEYQNLQNHEYLNPLQRASLRKVTGPEENVKGLAINPLNIYSARKLEDNEKKYNNAIRDYSKYFTKDADGKTKLTEEGLKEYRKVYKNLEQKFTEDNVPIEYYTNTTSPFKDFITNLNNGNDVDINNIGELWDNYISNTPEANTAIYDATKVTEYDHAIDSSQQDDMKDAIMTANRGNALQEVDYDDESKSFKVTGEELTMEDLNSSNYKVVSTRFSPYGSTVMIKDGKGKVRRFRMPAGINTTNEQNRDKAMRASYYWLQVVNTGEYTDAQGNVHRATPDEITYAQKMYTDAVQQAYLYNSQLGVRNKTKEQEYIPYSY